MVARWMNVLVLLGVFSTPCLGQQVPAESSSRTAGDSVAVRWPAFLGPDRNGWAKDFVVPKQWPQQMRPVWQVEVGAGYGTPLVVGNRVYQHSREGDEEVVRCLNLEDGKVIWRNSDPVPFKMGGGGERHGKGPKASPAIAHNRLVTVSITGVLSAWDLDSGKRVWQRDYRGEFGKGHPYWGASGSPLVVRDRVVLHLGNDEKGALLAWNVQDGKEVWRQGTDGASYASPLLVTIAGVEQVVDWNHRALVGVAADTGKLLWEFPFPHVGHNQNMPTPVYHNQRILLGGENRGIRSVKPTRQGELWSVTEEWHQEKVALDMSTAVINGNALLGMSHYGKGRIFCLDTATGDVLWQGPGRVGENVAFLSVAGHVLALTSHGQLQVLRTPTEQYELVATYDLKDRWTWAPPVLLPDRLLIKGDTQLTCWSLLSK